MNLKEELYKIIHEAGIEYPENHKLIGYIRDSDGNGYAEIDSYDTRKSHWTVFISVNNVAMPFARARGVHVLGELPWTMERWHHSEGELYYHYDRITLVKQSSDENEGGIDEWNEWVTKLNTLDRLKNKI